MKTFTITQAQVDQLEDLLLAYDAIHSTMSHHDQQSYGLEDFASLMNVLNDQLKAVHLNVLASPSQ